MLKKLTSIIFCCLFALLVSVVSTANAQDFHRFFWYPNPGAGNQAAGRATFFEILYIEDSNRFKFYVEFVPEAGVVPNAFQLALNNGPNPKLHDGELAFFYFDASNPAAPKLSVYGYNAVDMDSWLDGSKQPGVQPPDKILSSEAPLGSAQNPTGWVKELKYFTDGTKVGFLMTIDATVINTHVPLYPGALNEPWKGAQFDDLLGMWFHPVANVTASYAADGFLSNWQRGIVGWYDTENQITDAIGPKCEGKIKDLVPVPIPLGQNFFTSVQGEGYGTFFNPDVFTVTYTGVPSGAAFSVPNGSVNNVPAGANLETEFNWTPNQSHAGQTFQIGVNFTDKDGLSVSCPFALAVASNLAPVCNAGPTAGLLSLACNAATTSAVLSGRGSFDPDRTAKIAGSFTYAWTTNCPGGVISDPAAGSPSLTFNSENPDGTPVSCKAFLKVSDAFTSTSCEAPLGVAGCVKDCTGAINGLTTFDACGKCGGSGVLDRCGVCNGAGNSCLGCESTTITDQQLTLDNNAALQRDLVKKAVKQLKRQSRSRSTIKFAQDTLNSAEDLHDESWSTLWTLPQVVTQCSNTLFCSSSDITVKVKTYVQNSDALNSLLKATIAKVRTARGGRLAKGDKNLLASGDALVKQNNTAAAKIPPASTNCTESSTSGNLA